MGHSDVILSMMFLSNQSGWIVSGSRDQSLHIWNIEQHTQSPNLPIVNTNNIPEEEISSNSGNKKRHKPRANRDEREEKKAAKAGQLNGNQNERPISSTNSMMNQRKEEYLSDTIDTSLSFSLIVNSLAYQLLWPSKTDRETLSGRFSLLWRSCLFVQDSSRFIFIAGSINSNRTN